MTGDPLQVVRELLAAIAASATVLVNPEDLERWETAVADSGLPVRVLPTPGVPAGQVVTLMPRTLNVTQHPRRRSDD